MVIIIIIVLIIIIDIEMIIAVYISCLRDTSIVQRYLLSIWHHISENQRRKHEREQMGVDYYLREHIERE